MAKGQRLDGVSWVTEIENTKRNVLRWMWAQKGVAYPLHTRFRAIDEQGNMYAETSIISISAP